VVVDTAYAGSEDETKLIEAIAALSTAATIFITNTACSAGVAVVVSIANIIVDILVVAAAITSDVIFATLNTFNNKSAASVN
jgi:precorrin isomerase